jgi:hypothetical protein
MKAGTSIITLVEGLGLDQVLQQAFARDVERHARTIGRPHAGHRVEQLPRVELGIGSQGEDGQARGRDGAMAVDERRIAQGHLAQDGITHVLFLPVGRCSSEAQVFKYWNNESRCTIEYDFSAAS